MKRGDIIDIDVDSIAFGGAGIGRHTIDDRAFTVFVDGTVPGDRVRVRIGRKKRNYANGYIEEFLHRAPNRIKPRCKHFGETADGGIACGGCSLQYLSYEDQLQIKEQHVRDAIKRIGGLDESKVLPIIGCGSEWNYRNKMEFSFSRELVSRGGGGSGKVLGKLGLGLHVKKRHHDTVELTGCHLFSPYVGDFVSEVRDFFRDIDAKGMLGEGVSFARATSQGTPLRCVPPTLKSLFVREGKNTGEIMVNLCAENGEAENFVFTDVNNPLPAHSEPLGFSHVLDDFLLFIRDFFDRASLGGNRHLASVYYTHYCNKKGQPKTADEKLLWGAPVINEVLKIGPDHELEFEISPQAFFQPNTYQAEKLFALVLESAGLNGTETVYDLYCGAGTIGLACAKDARKVYGIELNESAASNARANAELNGIKNAVFIVGDVLAKMPDIEEDPDTVIVDPPRSGLRPELIECISELVPQKIVYVSCNPASLARDLALFSKTGYTLDRVQPVDMFPQTYHIENVALLVR